MYKNGTLERLNPIENSVYTLLCYNEEEKEWKIQRS